MTPHDLRKKLGDGTKSSKFRLTITRPTIQLGETVGDDTISFLVKASVLPGKTISTTEIWSQGRKFEVRDTAEFTGKWNVTFYNDDKFAVRNAIDDWMYYIDGFKFNVSPYLLNYGGIDSTGIGYMTNMYVEQLGLKGETIAKYELSYCFPTSLSEIPLDSASNELTTTDLEFTYSYWERKD